MNADARPMWSGIIVLYGSHKEPAEGFLLASDQEFSPLTRDCHFLIRGYIV